MESNVRQIIILGDNKLTCRRKGNLDHKQVSLVQCTDSGPPKGTQHEIDLFHSLDAECGSQCGMSGNINQENQPKEYQRHYY